MILALYPSRVRSNELLGGSQLSLTLRPSIRMLYIPSQLPCHLQPFAVPGAFASINPREASAERFARQCGHLGEASARNLPPHAHGSSRASASGFTGPCTFNFASMGT